MSTAGGRPEELFRQFLSATGTIEEIVGSFRLLSNELLPKRREELEDIESLSNKTSSSSETRTRGIKMCEVICGQVNCKEAKTLLQCLTNRAGHTEYGGGTVCSNLKVCSV